MILSRISLKQKAFKLDKKIMDGMVSISTMCKINRSGILCICNKHFRDNNQILCSSYMFEFASSRTLLYQYGWHQDKTNILGIIQQSQLGCAHARTNLGWEHFWIYLFTNGSSVIDYCIRIVN